MNTAQALARIPVGIVVERRKATSQWVDYLWRPVTALAGVPAAKPWTVLNQNAEVATIYAGAAEVVLYGSDTPRYRENLESGAPALWVVLRPTGEEPPYEIVAVTADGSEGEGYTSAGADLVEQVAMPESVEAAIAAFIDEHHVDQQFVKRQRDRADPEALGRRPPADKDGKP